MTVAELKEKLHSLPGKAEIFLKDADGHYCEIGGVMSDKAKRDLELSLNGPIIADMTSSEQECPRCGPGRVVIRGMNACRPAQPEPERGTTGEAALLPCPFCGHNPDVEEFKYGPAKQGLPDKEGLPFFRVSCENFSCPSQRTAGFHDLKEDAVTAWNTRAQSTPPEQRASRICYHCGPIENCDCEARPEAVRMPPLDEVTPEDRVRTANSIGHTSNVWHADVNARLKLYCRERQLLAEIAAHERTRGELERMTEGHDMTVDDETRKFVLSIYPKFNAFLFHGHWVTMRSPIDARHFTWGSAYHAAAWEHARIRIEIEANLESLRSDLATFKLCTEQALHRRKPAEADREA